MRLASFAAMCIALGFVGLAAALFNQGLFFGVAFAIPLVVALYGAERRSLVLAAGALVISAIVLLALRSLLAAGVVVAILVGLAAIVIPRRRRSSARRS